jgi:hypothetical protein
MADIILNTNISNAKTENPSFSKADEVRAMKEIMPNRAPPAAPAVWVPGQFVGRQVVEDYNEVNLLEVDDVKQAKVESWLAKGVGSMLMEKYPNRQWGVGVDLYGGMIYVMCPSLSTTKAYYISMVGRSMEDLRKEAVRAAGEILERHGITRGRSIDPEVFENLERDLKDDVVSPDAAPGQELKCLES